MLSCLLQAAAGESDITGKLLKSHQVGDKTYKVHWDGYIQLMEKYSKAST